jgi:hypothetical protein
MKTPICELPPLALEFAKRQCNRFGMCGEILLTSWIVYAQCVENLECTNPLYTATPLDKKWFNEVQRLQKE